MKTNNMEELEMKTKQIDEIQTLYKIANENLRLKDIELKKLAEQLIIAKNDYIIKKFTKT